MRISVYLFGLIVICGVVLVRGTGPELSVEIAEPVMERVLAGQSEVVPVLIFLRARFDVGSVAAASTAAEWDRRAESITTGLQQVASASQAELKAALAAHPAAAQLLGKCYWITNMCAGQVSARTQLELLAGLPQLVRAVHLNPRHPVQLGVVDEEQSNVASNGLMAPTIEWNVDYVDAPQVWKKGINGSNIVVGVLDTGVQWNHQALITKYRGFQGLLDSPDNNYNWWDTSSPPSQTPVDDNGHGTHCTGTVLGSTPERIVGVAPGAQWVACKNMQKGLGTPETYIGCLQFMAAPTDLAGNNPNPSLRPHILSNSYGCPPSEGCSYDSMEEAVNNVISVGIFMAVAAGNSGPFCTTIEDPPAIYSSVTTVGALAKESNTIALYSSRGPTKYYGTTKPDVSLPGSSVVSSYPTDTYKSLSGTSMATPGLAGVVALQWSGDASLVRNIDPTNKILFESALPRPTTTCSTSNVLQPDQNEVYGYGITSALSAINYDH